MLFESELAIDWGANKTTTISYVRLRELCPCAMCSGETDALGNTYGGKKETPKKNLIITQYKGVGHYGLQFFFSDGHKDGIYTFELLKTL
tara:strand:+ start:25 stop:294 length:270 start_codon:yes stop_codon:yes gene_type:complete